MGTVATRRRSDRGGSAGKRFDAPLEQLLDMRSAVAASTAPRSAWPSGSSGPRLGQPRAFDQRRARGTPDSLRGSGHLGDPAGDRALRQAAGTQAPHHLSGGQRSRPSRLLISVDFPSPSGPTTLTHSPDSMTRLTLRIHHAAEPLDGPIVRRMDMCRMGRADAYGRQSDRKTDGG